MSFFVISICRYYDISGFRYDDISKSRNTVIPKSFLSRNILDRHCSSRTPFPN